MRRFSVHTKLSGRRIHLGLGYTVGDEDWLANESDTDIGCCRNVSSIASLALVLGDVNSDVSTVSTHLRFANDG